MKKVIIILIIAAGVFGAWVYFGKNIKDFKQTSIGNMLKEAGRELLTPPPLQILRPESQVVLIAEKVIEETNLQRRENGGLPALTENTTLNEVAMAKAKDMFANQYFEHVSPSGVGPGQLAQQYGYDYIVEGENLILGNFASEKEAVQDWMNSPGHRANILNNRYSEIGVAVLKGKYKGESVWIGVQEFGLPMSACSQPSIALRNEIDANQTMLSSTSEQINQIRTEIDNTNPRSKDYNQLVNQYNQLVNDYNNLAATTKDIVAQYNIQVNNFNVCVKGQQ
jgi:uncharacterized protein YkwD